MEAVARGYSNLEFDLESGGRGSRQDHVEALLRRVTGAEAALAVNNCAAAVMLALESFAADGEVIVSRGELVEIGGSFRMPDVIAKSGARMVEVGTTNKTRLEDYAAALSDKTRIVLAVHPSNFRIVGFSSRPALKELASPRPRQRTAVRAGFGQRRSGPDRAGRLHDRAKRSREASPPGWTWSPSAATSCWAAPRRG